MGFWHDLIIWIFLLYTNLPYCLFCVSCVVRDFFFAIITYLVGIDEVVGL